MWWSEPATVVPGPPARRAVLLGLSTLGLAACGFTPALGPAGALTGLHDRVRLSEPQDRNGFFLNAALEDRLGSGNDFDLITRIETRAADVGITPDRVITREQIDGTVDITLRDRATDAILLKDRVSAFTSYGTTGTTASTAFARQAAYERLMVMLADRILDRLAALPSVPR